MSVKTPKSFEKKICNRANIKHVIVPEGIWIQKYDKPVFHQFLQPLDKSSPPTKALSSISGNFLYMIINGKLHLVTLTSNSLFADLCEPETTFVDADFSYDEKFLYAMTSTNNFVFFSTIPPKKIQTFAFYSQNGATSFVLIESLNCFMVRPPKNRENIFLRIPSSYKNPNPHKPLVLDYADDIKDEYDSLYASERLTTYQPNICFCPHENNNCLMPNIENGESSTPTKVLDFAKAVQENKNSLTRYQNALRQRIHNNNMRLEHVKSKKDRLVRRFDEARDRFAEYFYRIQRLIENVDSGTKVAQSARIQIKDQALLDSISIPESELSEDVMYEFYDQQFQSHLQVIKNELDYLLSPLDNESES